MAAGSGSGRRILTIGAVLCAVCGLVVAASAMPMVASESPANGLLDGSGGGETANQRSAIQAQDGSAGGPSGDAGTQSAGPSESALGGALADRAAATDNPALEGALYGLASLASLFADDASPPAAPDSGGAERTADPAAAGVDGEFGERLDPSEDAGEPRDADDTGEPTGGTNETTTGGGNASDFGNGTDVAGDGQVDGDGAGTADDGNWTDAGSGTDGGESSDESPAGGNDENETDGGFESGDGSSDAGDPGDSGGPDEGTTETGDTDGRGSESDSGGAADTTGSTTGSGDGTVSESSAADGTGGNSESDAGDDDDEASAGGAGGTDGSGLEGSLPGSSNGVLAPVLGVLALAALGYVFHTRDDPIGALRALPGRAVSLAVAGVVACSQALERAIGRLRALRSIAELPGLVASTLAAALGSAETRLRDAGASLPVFGGGSAADAEPVAETRVTARERIRRAFESVIDAAPMYRAGAATATPAEVARRARNAGAPADPVETITDSFRDVEYGDRDPESYLERTAAAHDRLRSALEADTGGAAADSGPTAGPAAADAETTVTEAEQTEVDADE